MQTPEGRADKLIDEFIVNALGPLDKYRQAELKTNIWQVINAEKEAMAREAEEELTHGG